MKNIFSCKRCGFCCHGETTVSLDAEDQQRMLEYLGISREEAFARFWRCTENQVQMKTVNGHCIFFDNGCTVHPGRPWRCRQWPLVPAILMDRNALEAIRSSCPGLVKDAAYTKVCDAVKQAAKTLPAGKYPKADKSFQQ